MYELVEAFEYHIGAFPSDMIIRVPSGFLTDLTSIPKCLQRWLPVDGEYAKAAVLHDYLYVNAIGNKLLADVVFLEAMSVLGVGWLLRKMMYRAVRLFGRGSYE